MAFNDNAVFTASTGYVYTAPVGTAAPTPKQLKYFDPETFGAQTYTLKVTGSNPYTLTVGSNTTTELKAEASPAEIQSALEKLAAVGTGGAVVSGTSAKEGVAVSFVGDNFGKELELKGGSGAGVTLLSKASGWEPIGHTNNDDLPEFGYDGGDSETRGSWQKKVLKTITTETPVDYVTIKALQFDTDTLEYYYGKNASKVDNIFGVDTANASDVERAVLIVLKDGIFSIAFSAAKAGLRRDESISLESDDFATLPLRATFVKHPGRHLFEWTLPEGA
ncbi:phage tail protein [Corynebacterium coyleae]|uniref:phage tail tube protein n=1 Tax=Corynebacterium coyleae TaxID=53374 RepID=UPI001CCDFA9D|nr:phage tail protein [Corynebacterium coyleae]UBI10051.1 phage tail protein [Corynebacterium coyleae]